MPLGACAVSLMPAAWAKRLEGRGTLSIDIESLWVLGLIGFCLLALLLVLSWVGLAGEAREWAAYFLMAAVCAPLLALVSLPWPRWHSARALRLGLGLIGVLTALLSTAVIVGRGQPWVLLIVA